jgi:competence protein ComGC
MAPVTAVEPTSDLAALTQVLRRYSMERQRVPQSLAELVAAGYLKSLPAAPAGKQFAINAKKVEVMLVNQ